MSKEVEISEPSLKDRIVLQGKKIRGHVEENKWVYIGGVIVVLSRGYFKPKMAPTFNVADIMTTVRPIGILSKQDVTTTITKVYSDGRGRPGNLIRLVGRPDITYPSQSEAARIFGVSDKVVSEHLAGKVSDIYGYRLERVLV
jgi:hypothetical protein